MQRKVKQDLVVPPSLAAPSENKNYVIPTGYYVLASPLIAGMDPRMWKEHDKWTPIRWSDSDNIAVAATRKDDSEKVDYGFGAVSKGTESPYQPFGAGRHRCIGEQFAYVQLSAILATILRHVELKLPAGVIPPENFHVSPPPFFRLAFGSLLTDVQLTDHDRSAQGSTRDLLPPEDKSIDIFTHSKIHYI